MTPKPIIYVVLLVVLLALVGLRLYKTPHAAVAAEEQAVILKLKLVSGPMGNEEERKRITELEDQLANAIKKSSSGDFDGDEYGEGFCTIYMYGPSAERLFTSVLPMLKGFRISQWIVCDQALRKAGIEAGSRRGARADSTAPWASVGPNYRALPGIQAAH